MKKLVVMTIVGTRPELIKMSEIIKKCDIYFEHILVHSGQNYDYTLNKVFFEDLRIREPNYYLNVVGNSLGETMGNIISKSFELMSIIKPDALVVLGDTNSCLCVISAKRLKIPVFHIEAGNRCKDENLPEEVIRRIVDVTSDVNLCYSEHARRYILSSGVRPEYTFVIGSPMREIMCKYRKEIETSDILDRLGLKKGNYFLLSAHREENIDNESSFFSLMNAVNGLAEFYDKPILFSCHPRAEKFIIKNKFSFDHRIIQHKPFGFFDYNQLQRNAFCILSDSGTLPEENSLYKVPSVSIRTSTERPEAMDRGVFVIGSITIDQILQAVELVTTMNENGDYSSDVPEYLDQNISGKVVKLIQSYTGIINKIVWRKE